MIVRIVRMTFKAGKTEEFLSIFNESKAKIRHFEGCSHLELWQDADQPSIFTTCSHWNSLENLENYRRSVLFKTTWSKTKVLFAEKPVAFSNVVAMEVE